MNYHVPKNKDPTAQLAEQAGFRIQVWIINSDVKLKWQIELPCKPQFLRHCTQLEKICQIRNDTNESAHEVSVAHLVEHRAEELKVMIQILHKSLILHAVQCLFYTFKVLIDTILMRLFWIKSAFIAVKIEPCMLNAIVIST